MSRRNLDRRDTVVYPACKLHQDKRTAESRREIICLWICTVAKFAQAVGAIYSRG